MKKIFYVETPNGEYLVQWGFSEYNPYVILRMDKWDNWYILSDEKTLENAELTLRWDRERQCVVEVKSIERHEAIEKWDIIYKLFGDN